MGNLRRIIDGKNPGISRGTLHLGKIEAAYDLRVEGDTFVIRLDGHGFSRMTRALQQPFDPRFTTAMILTAADLLAEFQCTTAYVVSDEISLTFGYSESDQIPFSGRVQKLASLTSAFASVRFGKHLGPLLLAEYLTIEDNLSVKYGEERIQLKCQSFPPAIVDISRITFDARVFAVPNTMELAKSIWNRQRDGLRNCISKCAEHYLGGHRPMHGKRTAEKKGLLEQGGKLSDLHIAIRIGCFVKKELYLKLGTKGHPDAMRTRIVFFSEEIENNELERWSLVFGNKFAE